MLETITKTNSLEYKNDLYLAYTAAKTSPDPSNQNGSLIRYRNTNFITGKNDFPSKLTVTPDMITDREKKLFFIEHAERSVIYKACNFGIKCDGQTLICPWFACADCARAIILSGISKVVGHYQRMITTPERWVKSVEAGLTMLLDCGVELEFYDGEIGCEQIIVNGELWQP